MEVAVSQAAPVNEVDAELEGGLRPGHELTLIDSDALIEKADVRQCGFAHSHNPDLARLDELNLDLARLEYGRECGGGHPTGRTAANDYDPKWNRHWISFLTAKKKARRKICGAPDSTCNRYWNR
jgi:hypothetical protein